MVNRIAIAVLIVSACTYSSPDPVQEPETPPVVGFEFVSSGGDEGPTVAGTTLSVPVILDKPSTERITVQCTAISGGGNAEELIDFTVGTHDIVFEPGTTRVDVAVDIVHDLLETEVEETFALALTDASNATLNANKAIHTVVIADHLLPRIAFASTATSTTEDTPTELVLVLTSPAEGSSTVVIGVAGGATAPADGDDYAILDGAVVVIPDGAMTFTVPVGEIDDPRQELDTETVAFELKGASPNLIVGADKLATHAINDNDADPVASFQVASDTTIEGIGTYTVTVTLSDESELPVTVNYIRRGTDDTSDGNETTVNGSSLTFAPHTLGVAGETAKTFTIQITDDTRDELVENVIVDLTTATGASVSNQRFTLNIAEDANDTPTVQFQAATSTATEANNTRNVVVTLSAASDKTVTVDFTVGGTATNGPQSGGGNDFLLANGTVSFAPDTTSRNISVDIHNNNPDTEPTETVEITLTTPSNATVGTPALHTLSISD